MADFSSAAQGGEFSGASSGEGVGGGRFHNFASYDTPSQQTYQSLDRAFAHFNRELFSNRLTDVHMVVHRKRNARGYFWHEQFKHRESGERVDEIALNPDHMGRTLPEILSTLVHEMVHLWQQHDGKPSKSGHNKEWAAKMDSVGLTPTSTGAEGGKRTGRNMTHMIVPGGPFDVSCTALLAQGFDLPWFTEAPPPKPKKKDLSKVKHTCPECNANAWGKLGISLVCGACNVTLIADEVEA